MIIDAYRAGAATPPQGDPFWDKVVLLCGFEGTDGSTSFVDESSYGRTLTASGQAQIDTAQFKAGAASLLVDGSGDSVNAADAPELELGGNDFAIEAWIRPAAELGSGGQAIVSKYQSNTNLRSWFWNFNNSFLQFSLIDTSGMQRSFQSAWSVTPAGGVWTHVRVSRISNQLRLFQNGQVIGSVHTISHSVRDTAEPVHIGGDSSSGFFNGHIDEFRLTIGAGRDAGNFTPPTQYPRFSA